MCASVLVYFELANSCLSTVLIATTQSTALVCFILLSVPNGGLKVVPTGNLAPGCSHRKLIRVFAQQTQRCSRRKLNRVFAQQTQRCSHRKLNRVFAQQTRIGVPTGNSIIRCLHSKLNRCFHRKLIGCLCCIICFSDS